METILEIKISHDEKTMVAWDPFGEREITTVQIRTGQRGMGRAEAMENALKVIANRIERNGFFGEGGR